MRDRLNRLLRGWAAYFGYGTRLMAYRAVDNHVYDRGPPLPGPASQGAVARHQALSRIGWCSVNSACFGFAGFILASLPCASR